MADKKVNPPIPLGASSAKPRDPQNPKGAGRPFSKEKMDKRAAQHTPSQKEAVIRGQSPHTLTAKQQTFASLVAQGSTLSHAYRTAYDAEGMNQNSVWNAASQLADNPKVADAINREVERIERERPHDDAASRRLIREYLVKTLTDETLKQSDRTRAAELLGKVAGVGLFSSKEESKTTKPTNQTEFNTLFQQLAALVQSQPVEEEEEEPFQPRTEAEEEQEGVKGEIEEQ